jgi:hypothetical protein
MGRRYKSYAAETGTAYEYFFAKCQRVNRPEGQGAGSDYLFVVSPNQRPPFILRIFVSERAQGVWRNTNGRELDAKEMYAVAKMRLFRAFDEIDCLRDDATNLLVDESNVLNLAEPLGL